jgi:AraC-like DNA-binding protein
VSPTFVDRRDNKSLVLLLPVSGDPNCSAKVGGDLVRWGTAEGGCLLPITDERVVGTGGFRNQLMIQVDPVKLQRQASAMLGSDVNSPDLMIDHVRSLPLQYGQTSLLKGLVQTVPLLQNYFDQPELLNTLGISDVLMRQIVILLRPDLFLREDAPHPEAELTNKKQLVRHLCDYMIANLSEAITLANLEMVSGSSARSIQYAFQQVHGCSPLSWLRDQRLLSAQQLLKNPVHHTVSHIAQVCGFPSSSLFSASYRKRFGVSPTQARN